MSLAASAYFAFAAYIALALLPAPIVTMVIANGLRYGTRAALQPMCWMRRWDSQS